MIEYLIDHMVITWVILAVVFAVAEGLTFSMVTIWFTCGAVASAITAVISENLLIQLIVFVVVSVILLIFTRPVLVKHLKVGREKNNVEAIEGQLGLVTEPIRAFGSGLVKVNGIIWTAIGEEPKFEAAEGEQVEIIRVEGVKLIVKTKQ
ncbi:MAG: NfeD family protein [Clostridiales Family XIII bacterium]|nr:NfeD family protein [Clostridiales Family XIII bacterium]